MENRRKRNPFLIIALIVLLIILAFFIYNLYEIIPGEPVPFEMTNNQQMDTGNLSYEVEQFYPNMKFNHNTITYKIDSQCSENKIERMNAAFSELASKVGLIEFQPSNNDADIDITCSGEVGEITGKNSFVAGEGGAKEIIQTGRYNVIVKGEVLLYSNPKGAVICDWPNVELHELLHVFGFTHSSNTKSLMSPYLTSCEKQKLDDSIINDLRELYSQENLPDIYFEDVRATKRGIYLDFNITVKNSGVIDSNNVILNLLDNGAKITSFELGDIPFGAGVEFQVSNLRLRS